MKIRIEVASRGSKAMLKRSKILTFWIKCGQINHILVVSLATFSNIYGPITHRPVTE